MLEDLKEATMVRNPNTAERRRLLAELRGSRCRCGAAKKEGHTFCRRCYRSLPYHYRMALYDRIGDGYEEAYAAAVRELKTK